MDYTIYTISHPFNNEIVYLGCTIDFEKRKYQHLKSQANQELKEWMQNLADGYMIPKIEPLDFCSKEDVFYLEMYWIHQLQQWGFSLLNKNKTVGNNKSIAYKGSLSSYCSFIVKERKSFSWNKGFGVLGKRIEIENRNSFFTMFRSYNLKFGWGLYLEFYKENGKLMAIMTNIKPLKKIYIPVMWLKLKWDFLEDKKPKVTRYEYGDIGSEVIIMPSNFATFKQTVRDTNKRYNKNRYFNYRVFNGLIIATSVVKSEVQQFKLKKNELKNLIINQ